jgi:predicted RNase H-like HicB family nuclease
MQYFAVVHHEEKSAYGAHFPDVPGCFAAADELKDLLPNCIAALDDFLADHLEPPQARDIELIKEEVKDDLNEGAYLMMVPYIANPIKSERVNVMIDRALLAAIDEARELVGIKSRSAWIEMAARKEIEQRP